MTDPSSLRAFQTGHQTPATDDFSDVRDKLQREQMQKQLDQAKDKPNDATASDRNFAEAVDAFSRGDYNQAVLKFRVAMVLDPQDIILPFGRFLGLGILCFAPAIAVGVIGLGSASSSLSSVVL